MKALLRVTLLWVIFLLPAGACMGKESPRILVFAKTAGFYHSSIPKGMQAIMQVCAAEGILTDTTRDADVFTPENLGKYQAIVFLNTTGDVFNEQQQAAFQAYIRNGGGFVGIHAATDTEYEWPWYNKLVGAYFLSHPEQQEAVIRVTDRKHMATSMLPEAWKRTDEWYNFRDIQPGIEVLAYLDETTYSGGKNGEKHPFIWCREFEGGRSFYTGVGHRDDNYDEPLLLRHLLEAIKWAGKIR